MVYSKKEKIMKRVLVSFVEAGMGHIVTSQAIVDALKNLNDDKIEIVAKNLFHENEMLKKYEKFLIEQTKKASSNPLHSRTQFMAMHILGSQNTLRLVNGGIYAKYLKLYIEELKKVKPDIIIDNHYFTSYASVCYRDRCDPNCKVVTYDPDNNVHGWWCRRVDNFIVNNHGAYEEALRRKFEKSKLKEVFFITRKDIVNLNGTKEEYRKSLNLPADTFTVKLADGAYANAKLKSFVYELLNVKKPLVIIAICGRNKQLFEELSALKIPDNIKLMPFEFVESSQIGKLIKASDLFITKAGPNAALDSVFLRTPVMMNYYANSVEKTTKEIFVDRYHCGIYEGNKKKAREFVEKCIDNPDMLKEFVKNEKQFDKNKNGADEIAKFIQKITKKA